jgi:hypothetical protein
MIGLRRPVHGGVARGGGMKVFRVLLALVWMGVFWLPVEAGAILFCYPYGADLHRWYSRADAVAHVKIIGIGEESPDGTAYISLKILQSWKTKVLEPPTLTLRYFDFFYRHSIRENVGNIINKEGILYLNRDESGDFLLKGVCEGDIWDEDEENFRKRVQWLDRITVCGCKNFDAQSLHDAADVVVRARVEKVTKKGTETFADIDAVLLWSAFEYDWRVLRLTVLTEDSRRRKECDYPVKPGEGHILYLRRDEENNYSTDMCSGNTGVESRMAFEMEQPKPSQPKGKKAKTQNRKCVCEKLDAQGLYDRADAVVYAAAGRVIEEGTARFAEFTIDNHWKDIVRPERLIVYIGDVDSECRYPVTDGGKYLLYLRRDEKGAFSTDYCSGNFRPSDSAALQACKQWLDWRATTSQGSAPEGASCSKH